MRDLRCSKDPWRALLSGGDRLEELVQLRPLLEVGEYERLPLLSVREKVADVTDPYATHPKADHSTTAVVDTLRANDRALAQEELLVHRFFFPHVTSDATIPMPRLTTVKMFTAVASLSPLDLAVLSLLRGGCAGR